MSPENGTENFTTYCTTFAGKDMPRYAKKRKEI